jgi:hypothetical protein
MKRKFELLVDIFFRITCIEKCSSAGSPQCAKELLTTIKGRK